MRILSYGKLVSITGPMFAGKSEKMIQALQQGQLLDIVINKPLVLKHSFDQARYDNKHIVSHSKQIFPCNLIDDEGLKTLSINDAYDWIFIDEAQFFSSSLLVDTCINFLHHGINICCAGLNQDSFGKPFGAMGDILALSDHIIHLTARCSICQQAATKTHRLVSATATILVGGQHEYEPRCNNHWHP